MTSSNGSLIELLTSIADDELVLGHRDAEWTGYAPILEEDIAFSNIAQDEIGHSLVWYSILETMTQSTPDAMAFERSWKDFRCCRFVTYPRGDFAYTVIRQYLFDEAEQVRLEALSSSTHVQIRDASARILKEEAYHLLHSKGLVERLGDATTESKKRMQGAVTAAFPQSLGIFEPLTHEKELVSERVFAGNDALLSSWLDRVTTTFSSVGLTVQADAQHHPTCQPDFGGRVGKHGPDLEQLVTDLQLVYQSQPGALW